MVYVSREYYKRTVEDAKNMLIYAKQTEDDVNNVTQIFYYPLKANCENSKENFRLMLVDEDLIKKVENGERY